MAAVDEGGGVHDRKNKDRNHNLTHSFSFLHILCYLRISIMQHFKKWGSVEWNSGAVCRCDETLLSTY